MNISNLVRLHWAALRALRDERVCGFASERYELLICPTFTEPALPAAADHYDIDVVFSRALTAAKCRSKAVTISASVPWGGCSFHSSLPLLMKSRLPASSHTNNQTSSAADRDRGWGR